MTDCKWVQDQEGTWNTDCGEAFEFIEGDPAENNTRFCCYCGKPLKAVPFVDPSDEERP
jgi:hypothetical protein